MAYKHRVIPIILLLFFGAVFAYYWQVKAGKPTVYTHLFYIPIVLSALWFGRAAIVTSLISIVIVQLGTIAAGGNPFEADKIARSVSLLFVGTISGLLGKSLIQEREKLAQVSSQLSKVFQISPVALVLFSEDLKIKLFNKSFEQLAGIKEQEIKEKFFTDFFGKAKFEIRELHKRLLAGDNLSDHSLSVQIIDSQGRVRDILLMCTLIPETKDTIAALTDVTSEKSVLKFITELLWVQKLVAEVNLMCIKAETEEELYESVVAKIQDYFQAKSVFLAKRKNNYIWDIIAKKGAGQVAALENLVNQPKMQRILNESSKVYVINPKENAPSEFVTIHSSALEYDSIVIITVKDLEHVAIFILNGPEIHIDFEVNELLLQMAHTILLRTSMIKTRAERDEAYIRIKREQNYLKHVLDMVPEPLLIFDNSYVIEWANREALEQLQALPGSNLGEIFKDFEALSKLKELEDTGTMEFEFELNGYNYWVSARNIGYASSADKRAIMLTFKNLKVHGMMQAEAVKVAHLASIGELAAGVAHEINNPINGIINIAQMVIDMSEGQPEIQKLLQKILSEGERISKIAHNLLSFAKAKDENPAPHSLCEIITECIELNKSQFFKDNIQVELDIDENVKPVHVIKNEIKQVLLNVLSNSRYALNKKHTLTNQTKKIIISLKETGTNLVTLTIFDNGTGIPKDLMNKVFNPFFSTKPPGEGTGLGLSISYGIITKHKGRIKIESIYGEYTKVIIELPTDQEFGGKNAKI